VFIDITNIGSTCSYNFLEIISLAMTSKKLSSTDRILYITQVKIKTSAKVRILHI